MTEEQLTTILRSLVHPSHRNFTVRFSKKVTRGRMGTYFFKRREIVIYEPCCRAVLGIDHVAQGELRILGTGLHELAHHVVQETYGDMFRARYRLMRRGRRSPGHGSLYVSRLDQIIRNFNLTHRDKLQGDFAFNKRKPRVPPHFVPFPPKPSQNGEFPTPRE